MENNSPNFIKFKVWMDDDERLFEILEIKFNNERMESFIFPEIIQCFDMEDKPLYEQVTNHYPVIVGESCNEGDFWSILRLLAWSSGSSTSKLMQKIDEITGISEIYTESYTNN